VLACCGYELDAATLRLLRNYSGEADFWFSWGGFSPFFSNGQPCDSTQRTVYPVLASRYAQATLAVRLRSYGMTARRTGTLVRCTALAFGEHLMADGA
jgi:hypothetical protein